MLKTMLFLAALASAAVWPGGTLAAEDEDTDAKDLGTYQVGQRRGVDIDLDKSKIKEPVLDKPKLEIDTSGLASGFKPGIPRDRVREPVPMNTPAPDYPREAAVAGVEGRVVVEFTINTQGSTEDINILNAEPRGMFERAAQRAVAQWRYQPYQVNGLAQPKRVQQTINFSLRTGELAKTTTTGGPAKSAATGASGGVTRDPVPVSTPAPAYPRQAARRRIEGYVVVAFTVNALGETSDVSVIRAEPRGVFDNEARRAVASWTFRPALVNGKPTPKRIQQTLNFKLNN